MENKQHLDRLSDPLKKGFYSTGGDLIFHFCYFGGEYDEQGWPKFETMGALNMLSIQI